MTEPVSSLMSSPLCFFLLVGSRCLSAAGFDPAGLADVGQEGLHADLHTLLHEEGGDAGGRPALSVRRRTLQGEIFFKI